MNELYRYYRYHFSSKKPDRCCYCGRETIVNLVYADPSGKYCYDEDGDIAITVGTNYSTYYSTWRCDLCGQPYYQNKYDIDDSNTLYIYANIFSAWEGGGAMCIAIDKNTDRGVCTYYTIFEYKQFILEQEEVYNIRNIEADLLSYKIEPSKELWYDVNFYHLSIYSGDQSNVFGVESPYLSQHPLLENLISIIEKYNQKIRIQERSSKINSSNKHT